jgi:hypothetical protein
LEVGVGVILEVEAGVVLEAGVILEVGVGVEVIDTMTPPLFCSGFMIEDDS